MLTSALQAPNPVGGSSPLVVSMHPLELAPSTDISPISSPRGNTEMWTGPLQASALSRGTTLLVDPLQFQAGEATNAHKKTTNWSSQHPSDQAGQEEVQPQSQRSD